LQQRVDRDTEVIARLHEERDDLRRTEERLRLEHGTAREDHDRAIRERDEARGVVDFLRADLGAAVNQRLDAESVATRLDKELTEV
jgi:hypothetical protein